MLFTGLPGSLQELFIHSDQDVQDAIWRQWNDELGTQSNLGQQLEDIIVAAVFKR